MHETENASDFRALHADGDRGEGLNALHSFTDTIGHASLLCQSWALPFPWLFRARNSSRQRRYLICCPLSLFASFRCMLGRPPEEAVSAAMRGGLGAGNAPEPWRVQDGDLDEYIRGLCLSGDLLRDLGHVPAKERAKMYQNTRTNRPEHPESWLAKCVENWFTSLRGHRSNPYQQGARPGHPAGMLPSASCAARQQGQAVAAVTPPATTSAVASPAGLSDRSGSRRKNDGGALESHRKALFSPSTRSQPPNWAMEMFASEGNKSRQVSIFFTALSHEVMHEVTAVAPGVQWQIALACMYSSAAWGAVNDGALHFLGMWRKMEECRSNPQSSLVINVPLFKLVVVAVGLNIGCGLYSLVASLKSFQQQAECSVQVDALYSFETDADAIALEASLAQALHLPLTAMGDISGLLGFLRQTIPHWQNYFVLLLGRLPSKQEKLWNFSMQTGSKSMIESLLDGVVFLSTQCPTSFLYLLDIAEQSDSNQESWLTDNFGQPRFAPMQHYGATSRVHHLRTNLRRSPGPWVHRYTKPDLGAVVDGLQWRPKGSPASLVMTSAPSELICHGASERLFDASSLSAEVQRGLDVQTAVDVASLEERVLSVNLWLTFLGIKNSPIDKVLSDHLPCFRMMVQSTGQKASAEGPAVLCGSGRWCCNCEKALKFIGKCWHVPLMSDCLISLLVTARSASLVADEQAFRRPGPCTSAEGAVDGAARST